MSGHLRQVLLYFKQNNGHTHTHTHTHTQTVEATINNEYTTAGLQTDYVTPALSNQHLCVSLFSNEMSKLKLCDLFVKKKIYIF